MQTALQHGKITRPTRDTKKRGLSRMTFPAFDTHAYVKRLKKAGFNEEQAEAQAELQTQVLSGLVTEKLVTKEDNLRLEHTLKEDITRLEHTFEEGLIRIDGKFNTLNWMLGFILTGMAALLTGMATTLFKLFLHD